MNDLSYVNPLQVESSPEDFLNLGTLAEEMVYRLPGCADMMIRKTLQLVYREFCQVSWALQATTTQPIIEGQDEYRIIIPSLTYIFKVIEIKKGDWRMFDQIDYAVQTGSPAKVILSAKPIDVDIELNQQLTVKCVCVPTRGSENVPMWFADMYGDALVSGALFKLMAMGGKPWSDATQAKFESITFTNALNEASTKSILGSQIGHGEINTINYREIL